MTFAKQRMSRLVAHLGQYPWRDYAHLMRLDKPVGTLLLLWPTLWALWLAADGVPRIDVLLIFVFGVILMRAAGCVINDYADRHFDGHVERTQQRPLATGRIPAVHALMLFGLLTASAFVLVLLTNALTIWLSFGALALAATYPFMKRHTYLPQVVLGAAFGWAIPMAWAAQTGEVATLAAVHRQRAVDGCLRHDVRNGRSRRRS
jgi:4-hydroxybenzoate polyprenyltransferase